MDKFDDFLKEKAEYENEKFIMPESFDFKIEETLANLPDDKKDKWYKNKKLITMAACFAFVVLIGGRGIIPNNKTTRIMDNDGSIEIASDESQMKSSMDISQSESYKLYDNEQLINEIDKIESINIKSLKEGHKFKLVDKKEDIEEIINYINSLNIVEVTGVDTDNWDFLIQTNGGVNHSIIIKDNYISIDDKWYECGENISNKISEIYKSLNYEEKDIAYCNF